MHSGIDLAHVDHGVRPQDDLFGHLNGRWLSEAVIPEDRPADGAFYSLRDQAEEHVRAIIEKAAASDAEPGSPQAKVGDLYASFMDEATIDALGHHPIDAELAAVAAVADLESLASLLGELQMGGVGGFMSPYVNTDAGASDRYVIYIEQSGLGLPDESYYSGDDFAEIRSAYQAHLARMFEIVEACPAGDGEGIAKRIMALETDIAAVHWSAVKSRDAMATYNKVTFADVEGWLARFPLSRWLDGAQAPQGALDEVVVRQPSFLEGIGGLLTPERLDDFKLWLQWQVIRSSASLLSSPIVEASFDFYGKTLSGIPQLRERWKRGVSMVEGALGEAVGEIYVAEHFPPASKEHMQRLVENLVEAYRQSISSLTWMSEETRERALEKLSKFTPKIGYPDNWRDYSQLEIRRDDLAGNARRAAAFEGHREWAKLGGPVDRSEWFMTPQTVNAYYNPGMNEIVFPAAILQPPFFDPDADDAVNYGAIGAVIGHEIGHGFDDQGSRFDGDGNLVDWWTEDDRARFDELSGRLIAQYDAFEPRDLPGHRVNGSLTVGENIGDLGGVGVAFRAYQLSLGDQESPTIDGLTGEQRFFLGWAQAWRAKTREAEAIRRLTIDPHSPPEFRCNVVSNLDAFHAAFEVQPGDGMWLDPDDRVRIW